jgi:hypothetical protein
MLPTASVRIIISRFPLLGDACIDASVQIDADSFSID